MYEGNYVAAVDRAIAVIDQQIAAGSVSTADLEELKQELVAMKADPVSLGRTITDLLHEYYNAGGRAL